MANRLKDFEITERVTTTIRLGNRTYNLASQGPGTWLYLCTEANYGQDESGKFRAGTFGDNFDLSAWACANRHSEDRKVSRYANEFARIVINHQVTGNTRTYGGTKDLIFAVDKPQVVNGNVIIDEQNLIARLGRRQVESVIFSDDGLVRAMPRSDVRYGRCDPTQASKSSFPILLTGIEESPEMTVQMISPVKMTVYFWVPREGEIRVPKLGDYGGELGLYGDGGDEFGYGKYSFGVRQ